MSSSVPVSLLAVLPFLLGASPEGAPVPGSEAREAQLARAKGAAEGLKVELLASLEAALKSGGPAAAVEVCGTVARMASWALAEANPEAPQGFSPVAVFTSK